MDSNEINIQYRLRKGGRWEIEPNWMGVWLQMNDTETHDGVIFMAAKESPTSVKNKYVVYEHISQFSIGVARFENIVFIHNIIN